jgi:ferrochelatase
MAPSRTGLLLTQLGTPASPATGDVRRYLREFLSDPHVIDLSAPARWMLVNLVIAPFRAPKSARAYRSIWTERGSPLLFHSLDLESRVGAALGEDFVVALGMRYGAPSISDALDRLAEARIDRLIALPLFPQQAASSSGTAVEAVARLAAARPGLPAPEMIPAFHADAGFIAAAAEIAAPILAEERPDHVLMSYHGLPERHIRAADPSGAHCLASDDCCAALGEVNRGCYRAQCFATTRALVDALGLDPATVSTSFQSRLGRTPWIQPFTDFVLPDLAASGVKRLAVLCPSFVADCLETVEEIGIRAEAQWRELGGERLRLVPCVNAEPAFVEAVAAMVRRA